MTAALDDVTKREPAEAVWADGVVFTGAGPPVGVAGRPQQHPRVFDGRSYWLAERALV